PDAAARAPLLDGHAADEVLQDLRRHGLGLVVDDAEVLGAALAEVLLARESAAIEIQHVHRGGVLLAGRAGLVVLHVRPILACARRLQESAVCGVVRRASRAASRARRAAIPRTGHAHAAARRLRANPATGAAGAPRALARAHPGLAPQRGRAARPRDAKAARRSAARRS